MSTTDRDLLIKAALSPADDLAFPAGLADAIQREIATTPQLGRGWTGRLVRRVPALRVFEAPAVRQLAFALMLLLLAGVVILAVGSRREPVLSGLVPSYHGGPDQSGRMPGPGPTDPLVVWRVELQGPMVTLSMPIVGGEIAYFLDARGTATAIDLRNGQPVWETSDLGPTSGAPVLVGEDLILATDDGSVIALDRSTGVQRWRTELSGSRTGPLATHETRVLVGTDATQLHAVSTLDGGRIWSVDAGGPVRRSPAIADGVAFVAAEGGFVTAVDLGNGKVRWRRELGAGEVSTPAVADGVVVLARGPSDLSVPHEIVALDAATGDTIGAWPSPTVDRMFLGALVDGVAWTVGEDGAVRSVDLNASGAALEQRFAASSPIGSLASVVDDTIYITTTGGTIHALARATAEVLWESQLDGSLTTPVVIDGRVIVGTSLGEAVVLADAPAGTDQE